MARTKLHLLALDAFADYADVMTVDRHHQRSTGNRFQCLFDDGSTLAARTMNDVRQIGDMARGCQPCENIAAQIKARMAT